MRLLCLVLLVASTQASPLFHAAITLADELLSDTDTHTVCEALHEVDRQTARSRIPRELSDLKSARGCADPVCRR